MPAKRRSDVFAPTIGAMRAWMAWSWTIASFIPKHSVQQDEGKGNEPRYLSGQRVYLLKWRNPLRAGRLGYMEKDGNQIVESTVEARGARLGRPVLWVLVVSCALAVAFLAFSYLGAPKP